MGNELNKNIEENELVAVLNKFNNNNTLTMSIITGELVKEIWDQIEPLLQMVIDRNPNTICPRMVFEKCVKTDMILVIITDDNNNDNIIAFNALDIRETANGLRYIMIPISGGEQLDVWLTLFLEVARLLGIDKKCSELRCTADRKGWIRKLRPFGWNEAYTVLKCKIQQES